MNMYQLYIRYIWIFRKYIIWDHQKRNILLFRNQKGNHLYEKQNIYRAGRRMFSRTSFVCYGCLRFSRCLILSYVWPFCFGDVYQIPHLDRAGVSQTCMFNYNCSHMMAYKCTCLSMHKIENVRPLPKGNKFLYISCAPRLQVRQSSKA